MLCEEEKEAGSGRGCRAAEESGGYTMAGRSSVESLAGWSRGGSPLSYSGGTGGCGVSVAGVNGAPSKVIVIWRTEREERSPGGRLCRVRSPVPPGAVM